MRGECDWESKRKFYSAPTGSCANKSGVELEFEEVRTCALVIQ